MTQEVSLIANNFIPTTSFTGGEEPTIVRGENVVVRAASGRARIESYPGHLDLGEDYDLATETINGTIAYTSGSNAVVGTGTSFTSELRPGQDIQSAAGEPFCVRDILDDTHFTADRPATATATGQVARYLPVLFPVEKKRGVLRRGNAISHERKDIYFVGDGELFFNGVGSGFTATRKPKRLERAVDGTYTEKAWGFEKAPPSPSVQPFIGGWKGMQAGKFSFMFSFWNSITDGFSNPSNVIKQYSATDITIAGSGRFKANLTNLIAAMPANADGVKIWGSQSGGGVTTVNEAAFASGAWLECAKIVTTPYSFADADVDLADDEITIAGHRFRTAQTIYFNSTWGPFVADTEYFAIRESSNKIKVAMTAADANAGTAANIAAGPGGTVTVGALNSTNETFFEYLDGELGGVASGTNFEPPECEWLAEFANTVHFVSCYGKKTVTRNDGTSPGNYVVPWKDINHEAAPPEWRVSIGDEITGMAVAGGKLFCLTANDVKFVTVTGRTELARLNPTQLDMPFTSRPFWTKGGIKPTNIIVIQGDVFLYSGRTVLRSPSSADTNVVPFEIGLPISDLTESFFEGHVHLGHCGKNQQLCLISSASKKNTDGYWVSEILPYSLQKNQWLPVITVSSSTRDMIVSGVATISGRMEFLAGGRVSGGDFTVSTFRYDELSGEAIPYYIAFQPSDSGDDSRAKQIEWFRFTGRVHSPIAQIHGATWDDPELSISDIEDGVNSASGDITFDDTTSIYRDFRVEHLVMDLSLWCLRFAGTYPGSGPVDRLDEVVVGVSAHGITQ